jgi:hypothetical protein
MAHKLIHGTVIDRPRKVIHVVRIIDEILNTWEIDNIIEKMCEHLLSKHGEQVPDVVVVQGTAQETLGLFGPSYAVSRVRTAVFDNMMSWLPITLD